MLAPPLQAAKRKSCDGSRNTSSRNGHPDTSSRPSPRYGGRGAYDDDREAGGYYEEGYYGERGGSYELPARARSGRSASQRVTFDTQNRPLADDEYDSPSSRGSSRQEAPKGSATTRRGQPMWQHGQRVVSDYGGPMTVPTRAAPRLN